MTMETQTALHAFERAKLGVAPFRCVGVTKETYQAMQGAPVQPGTTCDYCGTGIMYAYWIVGADKRKFKVGSDCVLRTGDAGLARVVKTEELKRDREARQVKRAANRAARQQTWKAKQDAEIEARRPAFEAKHGALLARAAQFADRNDFIKDVCSKARAWASLTPGQEAALVNAIERIEGDNARRASSAFVGTVGQKIECKVTVARVAGFYRPQFGRPDKDEYVNVVTMRDEAGNSIVSKSPAFSAQQGETFVLRGRVKEHAEYRGEKQTIVNYVTTK